jgi:sodium/bile acid cotransporter 7
MRFLHRWWFLGGLAILLAAGFSWPAELDAVARRVPQKTIVAAVLFLMALPLEAGTMWRAIRRPQAVLLAVVINFGLLPLAAWPIARVLPSDLGIGLLVAAAVPSTLASAAVWTRRAGGNDSIALFVTMITNVTCFLVTPAWIFATTGQVRRLPQTPGQMIAELGLICVLPVIIAQLLRLSAPVALGASRRKLLLGNLAQCGILTIVLVGAVKAGLRIGELPPGAMLSAMDWTAMLAAVVGLHTVMLWAGHLLGRLFGIAREDRIAVGFSGSQKTLMVGIHIANSFGGLAILPMLAFHVSQLLVDTVIADRLRHGAPANVASAPAADRAAI